MRIIDKIKDFFFKTGIVPPDSPPDSKEFLDEINVIYSRGRATPPGLDPATIDKWVQEIRKFERPCRELILEAGDPGPHPITKIGGEPWWPVGEARPHCQDQGHPMVFMAQFLLSDIPGMEQRTNQLLSFHYCQECMYEGNMSWGWDDEENRGYEVKVFDNISDLKHDKKGILAEPALDSYKVKFADKQEIPEMDDWTHELDKHCPDDYPQGEDDFDEHVYPGLIHVARSKLGGWPTWVQHPLWPSCSEKQRMEFAGQIDWILGENTSWGGGGYAYLFVCPQSCKITKGELVILTT